jgi:NADH-quinone oxidoreductase subunit N
LSVSFPTLTKDFYVAASPVLILSVGSMLAMLQAVFKPVKQPTAVLVVQAVTLLLALVASLLGTPAVETSYLEGTYLAGSLAQFGQVTILVIAMIVALLFRETFNAARFFRGEISALFLMIVCGMLVMVSSEDLITLFVGLELSTIGLYAVVGYLNPTRRSQEGAIKYFVLGSFAAALLLFGFGLLYASTGSMRLSDIVEALPKLVDHNWVRLGVVFSLAGLGFKLALAPFHLWAPDTYEAAPTGITAFMATTVKAMILIVAMRLFASGLTPIYDVWLPALMFLAMVSMILGNIMALVQTSLKRMLAYSSIAHSGYMAIAICALGGQSGSFPVAAILYYLVGYAIISLAAFAILMWLETDGNDNLMLDDLAGLAKTHPWAAFALAFCMFSFAGMPPTVGFMGKFFVFNAAISSHLFGIVIIGVIGSSISLFYYLRVIVKMYMSEPVKVALPLAPSRSFVITGLLGVALALALALGTVLPGTVMESMGKASAEVANKAHHPASGTTAGH